MKKALIIIDMQNDFMPGGALAVPKADLIIPYINKIQSDFDLVVATQDWHPADHLSFYTQHEGKKAFDEVILPNGVKQTLWPPHCIQGTHGAEFHKALNLNKVAAIFRKGMNRDCDSYSAFFDNAKEHKTGLYEWLLALGVDSLSFAGVATEFCVSASAADASALGFSVEILASGVAGLAG